MVLFVSSHDICFHADYLKHFEKKKEVKSTMSLRLPSSPGKSTVIWIQGSPNVIQISQKVPVVSKAFLRVFLIPLFLSFSTSRTQVEVTTKYYLLALKIKQMVKSRSKKFCFVFIRSVNVL